MENNTDEHQERRNDGKGLRDLSLLRSTLQGSLPSDTHCLTQFSTNSIFHCLENAGEQRIYTSQHIIQPIYKHLKIESHTWMCNTKVWPISRYCFVILKSVFFYQLYNLFLKIHGCHETCLKHYWHRGQNSFHALVILLCQLVITIMK